jgi:3-deoxy-D-manno-octulosonic acid kinase
MQADERIASAGGAIILYDPQMAGQPHADWFRQELWPPLTAPGFRTGRRPARIVSAGPSPWILRHYSRGGFVGRFIDDSYVWTGPDRTRAFREWRLLAELGRRGLPVPRPVAARIIRKGVLYSADLITVQIANAVPMSALIDRGDLDSQTLRAIGRCIAQFHRAGAWHADLNAHNIQLDAQGRVYLLDFDKSRLRAPRVRWQRANLRRLQRSLRKILAACGKTPEPRMWAELMGGYDG